MGVDGGSRTAFANIDTSGRYTIPGLSPGSRIRLLANAVNLPFDVLATTNAEGRFEFGSLSPGAGSLLAGDGSDAMDSKPIEIRGNTNVVDFDLTPFIQSGPWMFLPE